MTIEQKAQRYDEALEKAHQLCAYPTTKPFISDLQDLFPELKENEDEKIRKGIIRNLEYLLDRAEGFVKDELKERIAWLEKQGTKESKKTPIWKHWKDGIAGNGEDKLIYLIKNGYDYSLSSCLGYECDYILLSDLDKLMLKEKQGEQKPFDYENANIQQKDFAEPKDYNSIDPHFGKPIDNVKVKYAGSEYNVLEIKEIAGVTYYGIKDEPNHIDYVLPDNCEIVSGYSIKENGFSVPTKPIMFSEQNPAWSEEDEGFFDLLLSIFTNEHPNGIFTTGDIAVFKGNCVTSNRIIAWIKSIKDRVQPKQEWSEEDESYLNTTIAYLKDAKEFKKTAENCINWLKSLRPQPKQEWSALDERNLQGIIDEIEASKNQAPDYDLATYDRFLFWLKSIKDRV